MRRAADAAHHSFVGFDTAHNKTYVDVKQYEASFTSFLAIATLCFENAQGRLFWIVIDGEAIPSARNS